MGKGWWGNGRGVVRSFRLYWLFFLYGQRVIPLQLHVLQIISDLMVTCIIFSSFPLVLYEKFEYIQIISLKISQCRDVD